MQRIVKAGGIPLLFPLLDIEPVEDDAPLHEQLARLTRFDLAVFISPNAVEYGFAAMRKAGIALPAQLKVATVGQGSARALQQQGVTSIIAPTERFDSEGLLALPELQNVSGWRTLIFRGDGGRELLGNTLKSRGAAVEYATCYRRGRPQRQIGELLSGNPDVLTVTSSEALGYLRDMLDADAREVLLDRPLFAPHPRIAELARRQGWRRVVETASGDDGLLAGLIAWAEEGGSTGN